MLCLWELHIALNYTCLWWVRSDVFFVSVLRNISVYALVIFITLSVLMIFSNLTFLDTKQSGVRLVLKIQRVLGVQIRKSFVTIRDWREKYSKKPRSFSNEVSSNNAKLPIPGQLAESFWLGNISIYLKPFRSKNLQNWIFFHDRRSFTDFSAPYTVLKLEKMVTGVLEK